MKTFVLLLVFFVLSVFMAPAMARPDCSNVDPTSRLAGCFGIPDFEVQTSRYETGREDTPHDNCPSCTVRE